MDRKDNGGAVPLISGALAAPLLQVAGAKIDEVFIGSCMTNMGHFRAAGKLLDKVEGSKLGPACGRTRLPAWTSTS